MRTTSNGSYFLFVNGDRVGGRVPVRLIPGRTNRVAVESAPAASGTVRIELHAPDGRGRVLREPLAGGRADIALGLCCVPATYLFEAGVVFRKGYGLIVEIADAAAGGGITARFTLAAVCSRDEQAEWLLSDAPERAVYNDGFIPDADDPRRTARHGGFWNPFADSAGAMQPSLELRLDPAVLADRDAVTVCFRTRPNPCAGTMRTRVTIRDERGREPSTPVEFEADPHWRTWRPAVSAWPAGAYTLELQPAGESGWEDGPRIVYRREAADPLRVRVSPYAPFELKRDPAREEKVVADWPSPLPAGWSVDVCGSGSALLCEGDPSARPVVIDPRLTGLYAVFALPVNTILLRAGRGETVRRVHEPEQADFGDLFVAAVDLTGQTLELHANDLNRMRAAVGSAEDLKTTMLALYANDGTRPVPFDAARNGAEIRSGIRRIRLVPVTVESVAAFREQTANPPRELRGVEDWWCYFQGADRADPEQLDALLRGQRELGIRVLNWAVGRSWVQYPSRLPDARMFPGAPIDDAAPIGKRHHHLAWQQILGSCDCLGYPLARRAAHDVRLQGWLTMNRHYGSDTLGGIFTSPWVASHPEYYQCRKDLRSVDYTRLEYFFPEVRQERLDILEEVAGYGPDALVIGCCRQPPMGSYNAALVAAYRERTGVDPAVIDSTDGQPYLDWIRWRAGFFTELLRELAVRLNRLAETSGRRVPVVARIPGIGLEWNLAQGLDVETWVREGLVDELQLDPLECAAGRASHDVRPYLALGRAHGVPVFGGVNGTTGANLGFGPRDQFTPVTGLKRAIGLLRAGAVGIEIYEAEIFSRVCERRWLIPLWGDPERAERWLAASNLDAVFPVTARNAALGHDNHWWDAHQTLAGAHGLPRGAQRAL